MENVSFRAMDSQALRWVLIVVLLVVAALALTRATATQAQGICPPPITPACRGDSGGGGVPAPTPPPGGGGEPGGPGDPGGGGGDPTPPPGGGGGDGGGGSGGGGGGGGNPGDGTGTYQNYYCSVHPIAGTCPELSNYTVYCGYDGTCWVVSHSCVSLAACTPTPGQPGDPEKPCIPTYNPGTGLGFVCEGDDGNGFNWGYGIQAWANIPPHNVRVYPFPRWLVGAPGMLSLTRDPLYSVVGGERGGGEGGFWSQRVSIPSSFDPADPPPGTIRDYSIGVRWRMVLPGQQIFDGPVPESCWNFDERAWNVAGGYAAGGACGDSVVHTYETSSFGLTANGPRFDYEASGCAKVPADWTLPAYQVTVPTYWSVEWADEWWEWTATGTQWSECQCVGTGRPSGIPTEGCTPPAGICHLPGEWYGKIGEPRYEWIHHFVGWYPIDLREYGESAWYSTSFRVVTEGEGGDWCPGTLYTGGPGNAVPVPVIESQAIIVDPCRLDGSCGDLNP